MKRVHIAVVALLLGLAAVLGTLAATRTAGLATSTRQTNDAAVHARAKQLDALAASLRRQLAAKSAGAASAPAPAPRVVYHRPPPVVVTTHHSGGDDSHDHESEHGDD